MDKGSVAIESNELSNWISTYGLVTVEKIYDRYHIHIQPDDIIRIFRHPSSQLFHLAQVPIKNIFNGLILQQAVDYQVYVQKLFIDYLLSGKANENATTVAEDLEKTRQELIQAGEVFQQVETGHNQLIAASQTTLFECAQSFNLNVAKAVKVIQQAFSDKGLLIQDDKILTRFIYTLMSDLDVTSPLADQADAWARGDRILGQSFDMSIRPLIRDQIINLNSLDPNALSQLEAFQAQAKVLAGQLKEFRSIFSALIVKTNELLYLVSDYHINAAQQKINQEEIDFNTHLGE